MPPHTAHSRATGRSRSHIVASGTSRKGMTATMYRGPGVSSVGVPDQPATSSTYGTVIPSATAAWLRAGPGRRATTTAAASASTASGVMTSNPLVDVNTETIAPSEGTV